MKKRVISGFVTVTGPPRSIWRRKIGITEPDEPSTFPNRTATNRVATSSRRAYDSTIHSHTAFDWPSRFFGFAALSVEMKTNRSTPNSTETSTIDARREDVVRDRLHRVASRASARACRRRRGRRPAGAVLLEDVAHLRRVAAVGEHRDDGGEVALVDELALHLVERRLGLVDEDEPLGAELHDLAAELRADRPAAAGHEHDAVADVRRDRLEVDLDLLAAEDVLDRDRPDLPREVDVAGDQLVQAGQRLDGDALARGSRRRPCAASRPARTASRSAPRRAGARGQPARARRSCRARGRRGCGGASCAGRRRRNRSACRRARRLRCISRTTSWPASPAPTISTSLAARDDARRDGRSISDRARSRVPATNASSSR